MEIEKLIVGLYKCNCYILTINNDALIIEPGDEIQKILLSLGNKNLLAILITHNHFDHIGALNDLKQKFNIKIYDNNNLDEQEYVIGNFRFKVIKNPGHTSDSISFLFDKNLFCGDFIFKNGIGRCDLPTGNYEFMKKSINKIKNYSKNIIIYPGHGDNSLLSYEIANNYYFNLGNVI